MHKRSMNKRAIVGSVTNDPPGDAYTGRTGGGPTTAFGCNSNDYQYKDGQFTTKTHERDLIAENEGMGRAEMRDAVNRRCSQCGGPLTNLTPFVFHCVWCYSDYVLRESELEPRLPRQLGGKPALREFADSLHEKR